MKGQLPKVYLRLDPDADQHPDYAGLVLLMCAANRQKLRGRFHPDTVRKLLGRKRMAAWMTPRPGKERPDLVQLENGTLYLDGWDEWQEGDLTVSERVARLRARRRFPTVTSPLPDRSPTHKALGVGRRALGVEAQTEGRAGGAEMDRGGDPPPNGNGPTDRPPARPPAAMVVTDGIRLDPKRPDHVDLVERCARIAALRSTLPGEVRARDVLYDASLTRRDGRAIDDACLVNVSAEWIAATIATCERLEAELLEESDDDARDS